MDLANLSLAEIASMLDKKQQEILLASISIAARYIQEMQEDMQHQQQEEEDEHHQMQQQHQHQHQHQQQQQQQQQQQLQHQQHHQQHQQQQQQEEEEFREYDDEDEEEEDELPDEDDDEIDFRQQAQINNSIVDLKHHKHHLNLTLDQSTDSAAPSQIKDFAEELKHRRKLIRLSQKGAAQSLRAFTNGQQPCTDAIIYHFENLQLEPERATQLIPLLRDWLEWAEKHRLNGQQLPMLRAVTKVPRERKRKVVLFNEKAKQYLEDAFLKNNHPDRYQLDVISQELNIPTRSIRKWFTNRRQRKRFAEKFA